MYTEKHLCNFLGWYFWFFLKLPVLFYCYYHCLLQNCQILITFSSNHTPPYEYICYYIYRIFADSLIPQLFLTMHLMDHGPYAGLYFTLPMTISDPFSLSTSFETAMIGTLCSLLHPPHPPSCPSLSIASPPPIPPHPLHYRNSSFLNPLHPSVQFQTFLDWSSQLKPFFLQ